MDERTMRLMRACISMALDWRARWTFLDARCWSCGSSNLDIIAGVHPSGRIARSLSLATCRACASTFGPLR